MKDTQLSLTTVEPQLPAVQQEPSALLILQAAVAGGITEQNIAVVERLCALQERQQDRAAEQSFNRALMALQADLPRISVTKGVPGKDGTIKYYYAPYEEIRRDVDGALREHGFAVTFDSTVSDDGKRVTVICKLRHKDGHSENTSYTGRIGQGPPNCSEAQADGSGFTYAKRFAFCAALGIVIEKDNDGAGDGDDARNIGKPITESEAVDLQSKVEELGPKFNVANFKDWLGVKSYSEVPSSRLAEAYEMIAKWERKHAGGAQ